MSVLNQYNHESHGRGNTSFGVVHWLLKQEELNICTNKAEITLWLLSDVKELLSTEDHYTWLIHSWSLYKDTISKTISEFEESFSPRLSH